MITLNDIQIARQRIKDVAIQTPLIACPGHSPNRQLFFKPENLQPVGAFKLRGAHNKIASLSTEEKDRGVIAFSSGNHAQGVAYSARALGVRATIVMPAIAPQIKIDNTKAMGAEVVLLDHGTEKDWAIIAEQIAEEKGFVMVTPFNDETIVAGQATTGMEILEDLPDVETILAPVGGGGLLSGVAAAVKLTNPHINVVGVEPEVAADAQASLRQGKIIEWTQDETRRTIADGMRATAIGDVTFAHIRAYVDDIVTVSEAEIRDAMRRMVLRARLVAEPSGAVTFAAFLNRQSELPESKKTVAIISGGNVAANLLAEILTQ
ncbi:MAG: threonine/serine dehydratase [Chloroflexota bacterium]